MPDDPEESAPPESSDITDVEETEDFNAAILARLDSIDNTLLAQSDRLTELENRPVGEHAHDYAAGEHAHEGYAAYEHAHEAPDQEEPPPEDISPRREHIWFRKFGT